MIKSGNDVISFLKGQHAEVKTLFGSVIAAQGKERQREFMKLRRALAVHETAEEEIIHPVARRALPDGNAIVDARLREENEAKKALAELEKLDVDSATFETKLRVLNEAVVAHADSEEREEFALLADRLEPKRLKQMRKAAEFAERVAPTRPHAGIESQLGNMLVGPFAAMIDRTHDAFSVKS